MLRRPPRPPLSRLDLSIEDWIRVSEIRSCANDILENILGGITGCWMSKFSCYLNAKDHTKIHFRTSTLCGMDEVEKTARIATHGKVNLLCQAGPPDGEFS
jgi:hypothetical protein